MGNLRVWSLLFWALLGTSFAEDITKYFKVGGQLELEPELKGPITNILWRLQGDLVAEWTENENLLEYYGRFKDRTTLDNKTGRLTMKNLTDADQGTFSVELNYRVQSQRYITKAILEVREPELVVQPLACHPDVHTECILRCDGDTTGAEPVTYSWREGDGEWQTGRREKNITKAGTKHVEEYSCQMSNPVSEKPCKPRSNPLVVEKISPELESSNVGVGVAVGVSVGIVILAVVSGGIVASYWSGDNTVSRYKRSLSGGASASQPEATPLIKP